MKAKTISLNLSLLSIIFVVILFSCQPKTTKKQQNKEVLDHNKLENKPKQLMEIDPRKFEDNKLNVTDFATDIKYIPLSNKIRLGRIITMKLTSKAIYIVSDASSGGEGNGLQTLVRFDRSGQNPIQIGRVGKGPREYLSAANFAVDEFNNRIYISGKINTVLVFDTLGNYIHQFKFQNPDQRFSRLEYFGNGKLFVPEQILGAQSPHLWSVIDTLGNVILSKRNSTPPFETHLGPRSGTFKFKDKISYWVDYNDTIFTISPDLSWEASYIITPGEHKVIHQNLPFSPDLPEKLLEFYSPRSFIETNQYLISRYNYKGKFAYVFIEKNTQKTFIAYFEWKRDKRGGIPNNFDGGTAFGPDVYFTDGKNEYLAGTVQPFQLKIRVTSQTFKNSTPKYPEKEKELEKLAKSLNENDNPVLMLVKLKNK